MKTAPQQTWLQGEAVVGAAVAAASRQEYAHSQRPTCHGLQTTCLGCLPSSHFLQAVSMCLQLGVVSAATVAAAGRSLAGEAARGQLLLDGSGVQAHLCQLLI